MRTASRQHRERVQSERSGSGLDFCLENMRPISPQKRLEALYTRSAIERERMRNTLALKAEITAAAVGKAEDHANRRELKKLAEIAARKAAHLDKLQRGWLVATALSSRVQQWEKSVREYRSLDSDTKAQERATTAIQVHYRIWKWNKDNFAEREARKAAARRMQKRVRIWLWKRKVHKRIAAAGQLQNLISSFNKIGAFPLLVKTFKYKIVRLQRGWRSYKAKGGAQASMISTAWDKFRADTIRTQKEMSQRLKQLKDKKKKTKGPDPERVKVEAVLAALPIFADKSVKEPIKGPLIAAWLKSHRKKHMLKMKEYYMLLDVYNEEMSQLQSILAARRAMGATQRTEMPTRPWKPTYGFIPRDEVSRCTHKERALASCWFVTCSTECCAVVCLTPGACEADHGGRQAGKAEQGTLGDS